MNDRIRQAIALKNNVFRYVDYWKYHGSSGELMSLSFQDQLRCPIRAGRDFFKDDTQIFDLCNEILSANTRCLPRIYEKFCMEIDNIID